MANRQEYRACVKPYITGTGKTKEQRQMDFCIGAKICSKGVSQEEAKRICSLPKEPKPKKKAMRKRQKETSACDPNQFFDVATQFKNLYINVEGDACRPCVELAGLIKDAEIPYQIVNVPETCVEILDKLGVDAFPTVIKMSKGKIVSKHVGSPEQTIESMKRGE